MSDLIYDKQILRLTSDFYHAYPNPPYTNMLKKYNRPYNCLLLQSHYDYFICVPYRTHIRHNQAYKFTTTRRTHKDSPGLDYTKTIIISDTNSHFIDTVSCVINSDQYKETIRNIDEIANNVNQFIDDYVAHCKRHHILHPSEFSRKYKYSTLKYFHKELHI